jgi:hypothetical protein
MSAVLLALLIKKSTWACNTVYFVGAICNVLYKRCTALISWSTTLQFKDTVNIVWNRNPLSFDLTLSITHTWFDIRFCKYSTNFGILSIQSFKQVKQGLELNVIWEKFHQRLLFALLGYYPVTILYYKSKSLVPDLTLCSYMNQPTFVEHVVRCI